MLAFNPSRVLIFVEDPGAVNFLAELPKELLGRGISSSLIAEGHAKAQLHNRKIDYISIESDQSIVEVISNVNPKVLVVGTSENKKSIAFDLIDQSSKNGIVSIAAVDMAVNAERRFRGESNEPFHHKPDFIAVPDEVTRTTFESLGFPSNKIIECGHPHYDYVLEKSRLFEMENKREIRKRLFPEIDPDKFFVVFLSQPTSQLEKSLMERSPEYSLSGWNKSVKRTDIVLEELIDSMTNNRDGVQFGVRLHPKNVKEEFSKYLSYLDFLSEGGDSLELLHACDLIIGMSTMLLFEAALMGKRTLSVLPRNCEKDWMPAGASQKIPIAVTRQELNEKLQEAVMAMRTGEKSPSKIDFIPGALKRFTDFIEQRV